MNNQEGGTPELVISQVFTAAVIDGGNGQDNAPAVALEDKAKLQSESYRRSRNVALMRLALLRAESSEAE
jgi:hypothetical protein